MHFANAPPWWLAAVIVAAIAGAALVSYRRPLVALSSAQRAALAALRVLALAAVALFLSRPILLTPPSAGTSIVVPILVDVSRSMRVADADGQARIARAAALVTRELVPALSGRFTPEIYSVGDAASPAAADRLSANARHSDLTGALNAVRDRYRGRAVSGIVLISDGGDTSDAALAQDGPPIFAVGVGSPDGVRDHEVLGITAGDPRLDQASVDLHVSASSVRYGRVGFELRVLANGRLVESRRVSPLADGSPIDEMFTVSPDPLNATVYTAEIPAESDEIVTENNARSVLVSPAGRKRRVLTLAGAPGFEHSFLSRALALDPGLEVDAIVRKGRNESGDGTFLVQAGPGRASALTSGFPSSREALYGYDALIIANVEGDLFTRSQLAEAAEFASERGGGLLVLGGRSFAPRGLIGTPLEGALPVELNDRRGGLMRAPSLDEGAEPGHNAVALTPDGEKHPVTRIGSSPAETRRLWGALPTLAASAPLGGPKPGATVLAVTAAPGGAVYPVVAVQRYGRGRSMVFAGEASWRWRMMLPSADRSYEYFWRQSTRWLAAGSPDQVAIQVPEAAEPGDTFDLRVDARDRAFQPAADAAIQATLTVPGGESRPLTFRHEAGAEGHFAAAVRPDQAGLYRVRVEARQGATALGEADRWFYVGGSDREFADPRLNEGWLRRVARASGGRYVRAADASQISSWLQTAVPHDVEPAQRDLWHEPWAFALVIGLLSAEWVLRRRWGLR